MRFIETIKWLLNHPPISINSDISLCKPCDYCGRKPGTDSQIYHFVGVFAICSRCQKKAYDKVLKNGKKKIK